MKRFLVYAPAADFTSEPSFRIRILSLVDRLASRGFAWDLKPRPKGPWARLAMARSARDYDGVILHRKMLDPYEARALRRHLPAGRRIFLDIDDAMMLHETELGFLARRRLQRRYHATRKIVDVVCAGNAYLAGMFQEAGARTAIVPSGVDPAVQPLKQTTAGKGTILLWVGSHSTLKYLELSFPALARAATRVNDLRLTVFCDIPPAAAPIPVDFVPWNLPEENAVMLRGDIGIAPTPENPWTLGKCGFKIVQYMNAGLPVIASPVGFNADLVQPPEAALQAGLLPATWDQWPGAIEQLASDSALRGRFGAAGRRRVEAELSLDKIADAWAAVLA
jgi:glycosyltransferase involved in cell wall biosynthesis